MKNTIKGISLVFVYFALATCASHTMNMFGGNLAFISLLIAFYFFYKTYKQGKKVFTPMIQNFKPALIAQHEQIKQIVNRPETKSTKYISKH